MGRRKDTRKMTPTEADKIFAQIAELEIAVTKRAAVYDLRIQAMRDECLAESAKDVKRMDGLIKLLHEYIAAHPDEFERPRNRKTPHGTYGMRLVSNLEVDDADKVIAYARKHDLRELYQTKVSVVKAAVKAAIAKGEAVPGARLVEGQTTVHKVDKALLDQARREVGA